MAKNELPQKGGTVFSLRDHVSQIFVLGIVVAFVTLPYFVFPQFWDNYRIPVLITAGGLAILTLFSLGGNLWENYRWIIGPAILILLVLIDATWKKSTLNVDTLAKYQSIDYSIPQSKTSLHVEYPVQVLYDSQNMPTLAFWLIDPAPCHSQTITVEAENLLFAVHATTDSPLLWEKALEVNLPKDGSELTILLRPTSSLGITNESRLVITSNNAELRPNQNVIPPYIKLEGKQNAQIRLWLVALLDAGSISIVLGIAIVWLEKQRKDDEDRRRKEEEEKEEKRKKEDAEKEERRKQTEISRGFLSNFDILAETNFSQMPSDYSNSLQHCRDRSRRRDAPPAGMGRQNQLKARRTLDVRAKKQELSDCCCLAQTRETSL